MVQDDPLRSRSTSSSLAAVVRHCLLVSSRSMGSAVLPLSCLPSLHPNNQAPMREGLKQPQQKHRVIEASTGAYQLISNFCTSWPSNLESEPVITWVWTDRSYGFGCRYGAPNGFPWRKRLAETPSHAPLLLWKIDIIMGRCLSAANFKPFTETESIPHLPWFTSQPSQVSYPLSLAL
ncbi:hypothetical protein CC78DRAFT_614603 [Lojkania enalia]|uniref:Uncharacterized protein n=1 Tax=Lojkania enalia TaxID=147567 RepID=A0A9P4KHW4_9PLEO|nr:hypothetical protein CC78DRAFT_614603 [Didymosphaeria enalia]